MGAPVSSRPDVEPKGDAGFAAGGGAGSGPDGRTDTALEPIDRRIYLVAGALFALLMAYSSRYGYDRDELYFLDCARHLSASYVDQPIFTPLVARLSLALFGISLVGLHLWSALAVSVVVIALVTLPVLPARIGGSPYANSPQSESIGWPELVHTVTEVWHGLPSEQRANAVIFMGNYGEAGAINKLGRGDGLPIAVSGHNSEWFWGPGDPHATTVVAVVQKRPEQGAEEGVRELHQDFAHVRVVATLNNGYGITDQEQGGHVYICTDPVHPWGQLWPSLKHFD